MILLLMRHGVAEDYSDGSDEGDALRPLTRKGRRKVRRVAQMLDEMGMRPDFACSSHRIRARETAGEVLSELDIDIPIHEIRAMDIDGQWPALVEAIQRLTRNAPDAVVLAAGHMPSIGAFFTEAITGTALPMGFKKGAVAALAWKGPISTEPAELIAFLTARVTGGE